MKNAYAAQIKATIDLEKRKLEAEWNQKKADLIHRVLTTIYQASAVALNEALGLGAGSIEKFRAALDATICEYGVLLDEVDADYADGKLEQRYEQIMGKPDKRK